MVSLGPVVEVGLAVPEGDVSGAQDDMEFSGDAFLETYLDGGQLAGDHVTAVGVDHGQPVHKVDDVEAHLGEVVEGLDGLDHPVDPEGKEILITLEKKYEKIQVWSKFLGSTFGWH